MDQRALARPGDAGDHGQHAERDVDVDIVEVVQGGASDRQLSPGVARVFAHPHPVIQVPPGEGAGVPEPGHVTGEAHLAPGWTRPRAQIDHMVGDLDHLGLVLDDEHRVALVAKQ